MTMSLSLIHTHKQKGERYNYANAMTTYQSDYIVAVILFITYNALYQMFINS